MTLVQGHETSEAEFVWWFERNPTKYVNIYLAEWAGRVIGVSSTAPFRVSGDGEEHLVPFSINVLTHPDHRGQGIFSALELANEEDAVRNGCPLMLSFPNALSTPIFMNRLGWSRGRAPAFMLKVLNPAPLLRAALDVTPPEWLGGPARSVLRRALREASSTALQPIDEFDCNFDRLWEQERGRRRWGLVKDSAYLSWRFLEAPSGRYRCWRILDGRELAGYLVTGTVVKKGLRLGFIADLVPPATDGVLAAALGVADAWFARQDVDAILAFAPAGTVAKFQYLRFAYLPTPKRLNFIYKILDTRFSAIPFAERSLWDFNLGDLDFF